VLRVERRTQGTLEAASNPSKETGSFSEAPRWPAQRPQAASVNDVQFPSPARATEKASATFVEFFERTAPKTGFTSNGFAHEQIPVAAVAFPQAAQEDPWPELPLERDSGNPAERAAAELAHLHRLALEQKGNLWIA